MKCKEMNRDVLRHEKRTAETVPLLIYDFSFYLVILLPI